MTASQLAARYAQAVDRRDQDAVAAVFTEDAVFVMDPAMLAPGQEPQWTGREVIAAGVLAGVTGLIATRHEICGQVIDTDGDGATGLTYCQAHHIFERKGQPTDEVMALQYRDTLIRDGEDWLISRREITLDWTWRAEVRLPKRD